MVKMNCEKKDLPLVLCIWYFTEPRIIILLFNISLYCLLWLQTSEIRNVIEQNESRKVRYLKITDDSGQILPVTMWRHTADIQVAPGTEVLLKDVTGILCIFNILHEFSGDNSVVYI